MKSSTNSTSAQLIMNVIISIVVVWIGVVVVWATFISSPRIQAERAEARAAAATLERSTLTGTVLCLPHTNPQGPQTKECALGLRTEKGTYVALDFVLLSRTTDDVTTGSYIRVSGLLTPVERLSTNFWKKYPIIGIFSVTDLQVLR